MSTLHPVVYKQCELLCESISQYRRYFVNISETIQRTMAANKRKLEIMREQAVKLRKLGKEGLQKLNQMHKLGDFNGGTVFEVTSSRPINTSNGECLLVDFSTESDEGTVTGKLIIPDRIRKEIEGKTPLILYYDGKKMGKKNQQFHDLTVINLDCDRVVKTPVKSKTLGKELVSSILSSNDNARATFSDNEDNDYEDDDAAWKPPICSKNAPCKQNNNTCYGWCNLCRSHQPFDGSQCVCH